jgi:hypothetical protein
MDDKELETKEIEKPEFSLDIEDDELELNIDDDLFGEKEKNEEEEEDEILTEDELESLIIGIDEENDILDIPDEEEVLEELKFFDENFSYDEEDKEDDDETEDENPSTEAKHKISIKEKLPAALKNFDFSKYKTKISAGIKDDGGLKYFLLKNKIKVVSLFASVLFLTFIMIIFITKDKKPVIEEEVQVEQVVVQGEIKPTIKDLESVLDKLTPMEKVAYYRDKLSRENLEVEEIVVAKKELEKAEMKVEAEAKKARDKYIDVLNDEYSYELKTLKPTLYKVTDTRLQIAFLLVDENFYNDLYNAVEEAFLKNMEIKDINVVIFEAGNQLQKAYELDVARHEFDSLRKEEEDTKEKIERLNFISRK